MQGRYRNGIPEDERRRLMGCGFSAAIIVAPFLALLVDAKLGLIVLAMALASSAWFAWAASADADKQTADRLHKLAVVNVMFLCATIGALLWMLV